MGEATEIEVSNILFIGMLSLFILSLAVITFFIAYQKRLLKQQKEHQAKEQEYQRQLLRANLLSQEKERTRIGKDLHDEVGAMLSTAKLYFRHINRKAKKQEFDELKEKALELLDETMLSVRRVSHDLRPVVLGRLGLVAAISELLGQVKDSGELEVEFLHEINHEIDKEYQLSWYRIVQELVSNTLRHAMAGKIQLELTSTGQLLKLKYCDNGKGIHSNTDLGKGLGIQNIKSRLSLMNGKVEFESPERQGFCLYLTSHLQPHENDKSSTS